jgi:TonB family protein
MTIRALSLIVFVFSLSHVTAQKAITGRLIDADTQKPVSQATVIVVGTTTGTFSNHLGFFQLTVPSGASELMISHVGYKTSKILIPEVSPFQIKIQRGVVQLKYFMLDSFVEYDEKNDSTYSADSNFNIIERSAEYPGGWKNFYNDVGKTLKSKEVLSALPDSTVHLFFSVEANGDFKLVRTAPEIKIIEEQIIQSTHLKKWKSAMQNNTPATQHFDLPIGNGVVEIIYTVVEETASPVGGMPQFYKYIGSTMKYPASARRFGIEGKVFVQFIVENDGKITNVKVIKGIGGGCDEEAQRVMENAPNWNPGRQRGKPVRQRYTLPIQFSLGRAGSFWDGRIPANNPTDFYKFVYNSLEYPKTARLKGVEGLVVAVITINLDGKITGTRLLKDIGAGCGEEVLRVLETVNSDHIKKLKLKKDTVLLPVIFGLDFAKNYPLPVSNERVQVLSPIKIVVADYRERLTGISERESSEASESRSMIRIDKLPVQDSFENAFKNPEKKVRLSLVNKGIKEIPTRIELLTSLLQLDLSNNLIDSLPQQFTKLKKLQELVIPSNRLKNLPSDFGNLESLKILGLADNRFDSFPIELTQLGKLIQLDLGSNQISSIPPEISNLKKLRVLYLPDNELVDFPEQFYELKLDALFLQGNPLSEKTKKLLKERMKNVKIQY